MILVPVYYTRKSAPVLWAKLDDEDAHLMLFSWRPQKTSTGLFYAVRSTQFGGKQRTLYLHREVLQAPAGIEVDHRNGDPLDCRRENLRSVTHQQNGQNQRRRNPTTFGYLKGVSRTSNGTRWRSFIKTNGRQRSLGVYDTAEEAARAYDRAAIEMFGEFAALNFPKEAS